MTDSEIHDLADDFKSQYMHGGTTFDEFDYLGFAKAILARQGTAAPASMPAVSEASRSVLSDKLDEAFAAALAFPFSYSPARMEALLRALRIRVDNAIASTSGESGKGTASGPEAP